MGPKDIGNSLRGSTVCNVQGFIFIVLNLLQYLESKNFPLDLVEYNINSIVFP